MPIFCLFAKQKTTNNMFVMQQHDEQQGKNSWVDGFSQIHNLLLAPLCNLALSLTHSLSVCLSQRFSFCSHCNNLNSANNFMGFLVVVVAGDGGKHVWHTCHYFWAGYLRVFFSLSLLSMQKYCGIFLMNYMNSTHMECWEFTRGCVCMYVCVWVRLLGVRLCGRESLW